jgi:hypothetical protein
MTSRRLWRRREEDYGRPVWSQRRRTRRGNEGYKRLPSVGKAEENRAEEEEENRAWNNFLVELKDRRYGRRTSIVRPVHRLDCYLRLRDQMVSGESIDLSWGGTPLKPPPPLVSLRSVLCISSNAFVSPNQFKQYEGRDIRRLERNETPADLEETPQESTISVPVSEARVCDSNTKQKVARMRDELFPKSRDSDRDAAQVFP